MDNGHSASKVPTVETEPPESHSAAVTKYHMLGGFCKDQKFIAHNSRTEQFEGEETSELAVW